MPDLQENPSGKTGLLSYSDDEYLGKKRTGGGKMQKEEVLEDMVIMQVVYALLAGIGYYPSMLTAFYFDSSDIMIPKYCAYYAYPAFILTFILFAVVSWICYALGKYKVIKWLNFIPLFWIIWGVFWVCYVEWYYWYYFGIGW
ncbi:hypothetical protein ACIFOT_28940 [Neobacillus sp. NRS-1170]|uniref:hypothetical protein n=1 Tax=Neobacillus sp. NRS-1170 TaxID=3233898 RepID=UPI003D281681